MSHVSTHTYAVLKVSAETYNEIRGKLAAAGYSDQFLDKAEGELIDMHGIALQEIHPATSKDHIIEGELNQGNYQPVDPIIKQDIRQDDSGIKNCCGAVIDKEAFLKP